MTIPLSAAQGSIVEENIRCGRFRASGDVVACALSKLQAQHAKPILAVTRRHLVVVLTAPPFAATEVDLQRTKDDPRLLNM